MSDVNPDSDKASVATVPSDWGSIRQEDACAGERGVFVCSDGHREQWHVRRSSRARHARVSASPSDGLVVVLPQNSHKRAERCLEQLRPQVERMVAKVAPQRRAYLKSLHAPLPDFLDLQGAGETFDVVYRRTNASHTRARNLEGTLCITGDVEDRKACEHALRLFVMHRTKVALPELLDATAPELGISYANCRVSAARKRWGSCSADGRIMLSAQLVFLAPELVFHVMCHELVHIEHLDHSPEFHARLEQVDPDARQHEKMLKGASSSVPAWMLSGD